MQCGGVGGLFLYLSADLVACNCAANTPYSAFSALHCILLSNVAPTSFFQHIVEGETGNAKLRLMTWNVRGLNDHRKMRKMSAYFHRHHVDVTLIQETHVAGSTVGSLQKIIRGACYTSCFMSHARGVLLW